MFAKHFAEAIEAAHSRQLDACAKDLWRAHGASQITDNDALELAEAIEARRATFRTGSHRSAEVSSWRSSIFPRRREQPARRHRERIERRRRLASSGPLPPPLAAAWTTARLAILRIIGDEVRDHGACDLTLAEIAARAGSCRTMARTTLRQAAELGLVLIEERRRPGQKNLPNRVSIISTEWRTWLKRGPKSLAFRTRSDPFLIGGKKTPPTDIKFIKPARPNAERDRQKGPGKNENVGTPDRHEE